jgi:hypothetical protein
MTALMRTDNRSDDESNSNSENLSDLHLRCVIPVQEDLAGSHKHREASSYLSLITDWLANIL